MILLDTTVLIDHLRGNPVAHRSLAEATERGERLASSVVSKVELMSGLRPHQETAMQEIFQAIAWIDADDRIAEEAGLLANQYIRAYPGIDVPDFLIAATATQSNATLWTLNLKHFPMFDHLERPY